MWVGSIVCLYSRGSKCNLIDVWFALSRPSPRSLACNARPRAVFFAKNPDEEEAVSPLLHTVVDILRLRQENKGRRDRESGRRSSTSDEACNERSQPHDIPAAADSPPEKEEEDKVQCQGGEVLAPLPEQGGPGNRSTFLLAFARRNVSIERVLREAESLGLAWRVPDDFEPATASENIYLMSLR